MLRYEYINKEWIVSPTARRVYRACAVISLMLGPLAIAEILDGPLPFFKQLLFVTVLATAVNLVGMEYFLFRFDQSHALTQVFWFCACLFVPVGPALYCFLVYSRWQAVRTAGSSMDTVLEAGHR